VDHRPSFSDSALKAQIEKQAPSFDAWLGGFKAIALTRGIGWAIMYWDPIAKQLTHAWVEEQHLGHLNSLQYVLGIDMWEHSYYMDTVQTRKSMSRPSLKISIGVL
jgi:Fe-Mn family superoxide dismutase